MALQYFSEQRLDDLRHLYCEDKLFRTFSPVLCQLQEARGELHPVILWHEVEALRERLKRSNHPETEVVYLIGHLRNHLAQQLTEDNQVVARDEERIIESMLCILLLLFYQLSDATPSDENLEANPNHVLCKALVSILADRKHQWYIDPMRHNLTHKKTDLLGNPIILPVVDYMTAKISLDAMDEIATMNYDRIMTHIQELSVGLQHLNITKEQYMKIWEAICQNTDMLELMCKNEPRTYKRGFNFKLFCNVLGILQNTTLPSGKLVLEDSTQDINNSFGEKNNRNYLMYYNQCDTNCAYNKEQFQRLKEIINSTLEEFEEA